MRAGSTLHVTGLTPGDPYNVRLEHRVTAVANATIDRRHVSVTPNP